MEFDFNFNEEVCLKLTEEGLSVLQKWYLTLKENKKCSNSLSEEAHHEGDGWYRFNLFEIFNIYGPDLFLFGEDKIFVGKVRHIEMEEDL